MSEEIPEPDIFGYEDYRKYLQDVYHYRKNVRGNFSFRKFSKAAGFASPNIYKLVMERKRNLETESIAKFCKGLGLNSKKSSFFNTLVLYDQTKSEEDKKRYKEKILANRRARDFKHIEADQYEYYSKWYYAAIRELVGHPDFRYDPEWIAKVMMPQITPEEAKEGIDLLLRMKLIIKKGGKIVQSDELIASAPQVTSTALKNFYYQMHNSALFCLKEFEGKYRDFSGVTLGLAHEDITPIAKRIMNFRRQMLSNYDIKKRRFDRVYQMNFALFPLTEPIKSEE